MQNYPDKYIKLKFIRTRKIESGWIFYSFRRMDDISGIMLSNLMGYTDIQRENVCILAISSGILHMQSACSVSLLEDAQCTLLCLLDGHARSSIRKCCLRCNVLNLYMLLYIYAINDYIYISWQRARGIFVSWGSCYMLCCVKCILLL